MKKKQLYLLGTIFCAVVLSLGIVGSTGFARVKSYKEMTLGPGQSSVVFTCMNDFGEDITDFTIETQKDCSGVAIKEVTVTSTQAGGCGDWDVDDNENGRSQEEGEEDNEDNTPKSGKTRSSWYTRVDCRGKGDENLENRKGVPIRKNEQYTIRIVFTGKTKDRCMLFFYPSNESGDQIGGCVAQLPEEEPPPCGIIVPVFSADDPSRDFILEHPVFEANFDITYENFDVIPPALDIVTVEIERIGVTVGYFYRFKITTVGQAYTVGENVPELLAEGKRSARFGVYIDTDLNGVSDYLLTTTDLPKHGVVMTPDFELVEEWQYQIEDNSVILFASEEMLGDHFEWVAFTGYSPVEGAYYETPLENVFIVPEVDLAYPDFERSVNISRSISGTETVTYIRIFFCPPPDDPPGRQDVPGAENCKGWMLSQKVYGDLKIELWCNCSNGDGPPWEGGAFGKRVEKGTNTGWVAKCPFYGGENSQVHQDTDNDGIPDKVVHTVTDGGGDDNGNGCQDVMIYEYDFGTNEVTVTHRCRNLSTGAAISVSETVYEPWSNPLNVPGSLSECECWTPKISIV